MPVRPSIGTFIPSSYLDTVNATFPSGASDAYTGQPYPTGFAIGKPVQLTNSEAIGLSSPGRPLPLAEGIYTPVYLSPTATLANCVNGRAAYWLMSTAVPTILQVTDESHATATTLFAGVFINVTAPSLTTAPNTGPCLFIFQGEGRVAVTFKASLTNGAPAVGDTIVAGGGTGFFDDPTTGATSNTSLAVGTAIIAPVASTTPLIYMQKSFLRG